jgi:hypothetical protein
MLYDFFEQADAKNFTVLLLRLFDCFPFPKSTIHVSFAHDAKIETMRDMTNSKHQNDEEKRNKEVEDKENVAPQQTLQCDPPHRMKLRSN